MDIFKWITGQLPVPERVDSDVMRRLQVTPPHSPVAHLNLAQKRAAPHAARTKREAYYR